MTATDAVTGQHDRNRFSMRALQSPSGLHVAELAKGKYYLLVRNQHTSRYSNYEASASTSDWEYVLSADQIKRSKVIRRDVKGRERGPRGQEKVWSASQVAPRQAVDLAARSRASLDAISYDDNINITRQKKSRVLKRSKTV
eukprot:scaffold27673_cov66-Skeletonema_marinoi.AAC.1